MLKVNSEGLFPSLVTVGADNTVSLVVGPTMGASASNSILEAITLRVPDMSDKLRQIFMQESEVHTCASCKLSSDDGIFHPFYSCPLHATVVCSHCYELTSNPYFLCQAREHPNASRFEFIELN